MRITFPEWKVHWLGAAAGISLLLSKAGSSLGMSSELCPPEVQLSVQPGFQLSHPKATYRKRVFFLPKSMWVISSHLCLPPAILTSEL